MLFAWQRRVTFGSDAANEFLLIDFWFVGVKTVPFEIGIKKNSFPFVTRIIHSNLFICIHLKYGNISQQRVLISFL